MTSQTSRPVPAQVLAINDRLVKERNSLRVLVDALWGELPADVTIELAGSRPDIVMACRAIHEIVNHSPVEHHEGGLGLTGEGGLG